MEAALWAELRRLHLREHLSQRELARRLPALARTIGSGCCGLRFVSDDSR